MMFGLRDDRMNLWGWFIEICEWYDKGVKCKFTNLTLSLKNILIMDYGIFFNRFELIIFF